MRRIILSVAIEDRGKYLLTKQGKGARQEGLWGFPGGNLEENETDLIEALLREVKEEVGIDVQGLIGTHIEVVKNNLQLVFFYFKATIISGKARKSEEIDDFKWLALDEIEKFPRKLIRPPCSWFTNMIAALKNNHPVDDIFY